MEALNKAYQMQILATKLLALYNFELVAVSRLL